LAIVPPALPTNRYRVRIARITHRRTPLRGTYAVNWDKRRGLPAYALDFCESLAAHMRERFPINESLSKTHAAPRQGRAASG
jgi:hypothetical protein